MNSDFENENRLIADAIESMLPENLPNGLTKKQARAIYLAENNVILTGAGLITKDRKLDEYRTEDHIKTLYPGRGSNDDKSKHETNIEGMTKRSEVDKYFEDTETPLSERSGILAKAMRNEGFKMNE